MSTNTGNFKYSEFQIETGIQHFDPKKIKLDDKYLYCVASDDQSRRIKIAGKSGRNLKNEAKLYKAEQRIIEGVLSTRARLEAGKDHKSIIKVNQARFLVPLDTTKSSAMQQTFDESDENILHNVGPTDKPFQKEFSAIVLSWNGLGAPPHQLDVSSASTDSTGANLLEQPLTSSAFERVWNRNRDKTTKQLKFHWTKVILFRRNDNIGKHGVLQALWGKLSKDINSFEFTVHHVPCKIYSQELTLREVLQQIQWSKNSNYVDELYWKEVVNALLSAEYHKHEDFVVHGQKFFDLRENTKDLDGIKFCVGRERELGLSTPSVATLNESICPKLFFAPGSVAGFMIEYFEISDTKTAIHELSNGRLQRALRGKLVQLRIDGSKVTKSIQSVDSASCSNASEDSKHARWRGKTGITLKYPDLPCIDVGTELRPALLPPEMVMLVPGQTFKRPFTPKLEQSIAEVKKQNPDNILSKLEIGQVGATATIGPKNRVVTMQQLLRECSDNKATMMFVTAGASAYDTKLWTKFQRHLRDALPSSDKHKAGEAQPLALPYKPGQDDSKLWEKQMSIVKQSIRGDGSNKPVAIVLLRRDEHHAYLYKTIKILCDVKVGLQSFIMTVPMLNQKAAKVGEERAARMAAMVMAKRIALRNPGKPQPLEQDETLDLSVAIHIQPVPVNEPKMNQNGIVTTGPQAAKTTYVVVLCSRDTEKSSKYSTEVRHVGQKGMRELSMADLVTTFVQKNIIEAGKSEHKANPDKYHRITILRSGYVPESGTKDTLNLSGRRLPFSQLEQISYPTDMRDKDVYSVDGEDCKRSRDPKKTFDKSQAINSEASAIIENIKNAVGPKTSVAYLLLSQNKNFDLSEVNKQTIGHAMTKVAEIEDTASLKKAFFITNTDLMNPSQNTIAALPQVHAKDKTGLVTVSFLGDKMAHDTDTVPQKLKLHQDEPKSTPAKVPAKFGPRDPASRSSSDPAAPMRGVSNSSNHTLNRDVTVNGRRSSGAPRNTSGQSFGSNIEGKLTESPRDKENIGPGTPKEWTKSLDVTTPSPNRPLFPLKGKKEHTTTSDISKAELVRLSKLWCDDRLDLYNTKLPIPTHLAYLAAKRALLHMRFDDHDKDDDDDLAPCVLDPVSDEVKDTLYFL